MDPEQFLREYEQRLGAHRWNAVADLIHDEAVFIFSEGTFCGKSEIAQAFTRTFETIQNERYRITDLEWLIVTDEVAACIYNFHWQGIVNGQEMSGGGRGTTMLRKTEMAWQIIHEHLSPNPTTAQPDVVEEAFGLWARRSEIDDKWQADGRSQWNNEWTDE